MNELQFLARLPGSKRYGKNVLFFNNAKALSKKRAIAIYDNGAMFSVFVFRNGEYREYTNISSESIDRVLALFE